MENAGYLFAAFTLIWAFVFGYILMLTSRQRRLERDIEIIKEDFKEKGVR
ncbi:CcmD family protein [Chloroflexota bacterium]